ncbi:MULTISPECIES: AIPR family protein [Gluconobacter]|uniref:AIPR family protein n=1 Tax=Gluconobacter cadivus TaxID=2728101 RepID=A0ABR9YVA0_9PROT|nr:MULTISPECIES: AIPR family protein [Gluconobacter]MBF0887827.1 AIPR family protein [Gluconobacter cadivus]MBS1058406.1 AIPR family protein [Gluconobacter sp. Dm-44]
METTADEFFHDFRQDLLAGAEANGSFLLAEFMDVVSRELTETGFTEGFEFAHYRAKRGMRVDGYWFNDEGVLNLFVADFDSRTELTSLTRTDVDAAFKRVVNFFDASLRKNLAADLEITSPEYGLARQIADRKSLIRHLNLILVSERTLSDRIQALPDAETAGIATSFHIWDISRLHRQRSSRSQKEALDLDFEAMFGTGIPCLPAHLGTDAYQSYLVVMPGPILSSIYEKFGARLLEQNVRTFLQARAKVNQGIRTTIMTEPGMFFAYNNGITATAQCVATKRTGDGLQITRITDLQIVNGGQTTASLFHTRRKDKADLTQIFVQMKLSVIDSDESEKVVPRISEYANTQNRVQAADFFSNHAYHIRMEELSRRLWAPAGKGAQRETKWFYERARGQYADAQAKLTLAEQKRFKAENPKPQMLTKTDLAKFENVWDEHPRYVNLGAEKNFARYAARIGKEWDKSSDSFNEAYFKRAVARGIIFRATERIVSAQPWYNNGYRANIVSYTLAVLSELTRRQEKSLDFQRVWSAQAISPVLESIIAVVASRVNDDLLRPMQGISNISEWAKREACWMRMLENMDEFADLLPDEFDGECLSRDDHLSEKRAARNTQKMDNGIEAQTKVFAIPASTWIVIHDTLASKGLLTPKEIGALKIAMQIPMKIPTDRQCVALLDTIKKARREGIAFD